MTAATKTRPASRTATVDAGTIVIARLVGRHATKIRPLIVIEPDPDPERPGSWQALPLTSQQRASNDALRPQLVDQHANGMPRPSWLWSPFAYPIDDIRRVDRVITVATARQVADFLLDRDQAARFLDRYAWRISQ